ncbi:Predicted protein YdeI with OB-fold, BOF family [Chitinophaga jiangningensis]|uniref:Uncharacterized protein n=1 Tax=Chitinophaga jiangningensis TaxID=1419482 RepID=A0A1M7KG98_9BACT|nr:NirD/YgiW/YdeI family stress tolerance protein [Chitinophaga jiangningensis]SHM64348.1 Predicted protein YdeI with OB-fold, BOF family [Chitinophaga jiangningensis]
MKQLLTSILLFTTVAFVIPPQEQLTVGEVLRKARQLDRDSTTVQLIGYITGKVSKGLYKFEDKTAEIKVYIDDNYLPAKPFDDRIQMVVYAWVQYEQNKPVTLRANRLVTEF